MGDHDAFRCGLLLPGDGLDHVAEQPGGQGVRGERRPAEHDRHRVAQPALELTREAAGFALTAALGGLADEHAAVGAQEDQRRDLRPAAAEAHHVDPTVDIDRRGRVGGAQVDAEPVAHPMKSRPRAGPLAKADGRPQVHTRTRPRLHRGR